MKNQKPIKLKTETPQIQVLGIVSKTGGHRISWLINSILNISLSLSVEKNNDEPSPYSVYFSQTSENYYKLLSNKNPEAVLSKKYKLPIKKKAFGGKYGLGRILNNEVMLFEPLTYMNLSGEAVKPVGFSNLN